MKLSKHERNFLADVVLPYQPPERTATGYRIEGMPEGQQAFTNDFGCPSEAHWKILKVVNGVQGEWTGDFKTADEALAALETELQNTLV